MDVNPGEESENPRARGTRGDVLFQEEHGEAFLLHVPSGRYFGLNPAGVVVWKALREGGDPVAALQRMWPGEDPGVLASDSERLIRQLEEAELIDSAAHDPGPS
jgi:hypothetical protein